MTFGPGVPFVSDTALSQGLTAAGVAPATTQELLALNAEARLIGLRSALFVVALAATLALFFTGWVPTRQPGQEPLASRDGALAREPDPELEPAVEV